jgi:deoxyribonuclease V
MRIDRRSWPTSETDARAEQDRLRTAVTTSGTKLDEVRTVAGLDVAYAKDSELLAAAVVVLDVGTSRVVEQRTATGSVTFPYLPGLLAFRELPPLLTALRALETVPDLLVSDGYGIAHPRRFGLASHVGVLTGIPSIGVAKTAFVGTFTAPAVARGASSDLVDGDEVIGRVLRTRSGVKPVFVSVGTGVDLDTACALTLLLTPRHRLPETTRAADQLCRAVLRERRTTS